MSEHGEDRNDLLATRLILEAGPGDDPSATLETVQVARKTDPASGDQSAGSSDHQTIRESQSIHKAPSDETDLPERGREFHLLRVIGKGGMGEVWEAAQTDLGRIVAVKRLKDPDSGTADFLRESWTSARLEHPNIVPVYSLGRVDDDDGRSVPMLAMKKVTGRNWRDILIDDRDRKVTARSVFYRTHLNILLHVIDALAYAHSRQIIHRDLKPSQVMVGEYGEVLLLDWGLSVCLDQEPPAPDLSPIRPVFTLDSASSPAGTPAYMAPEQTRMTTEGLSARTDIYLIGSTLYEILTGSPPHRAANIREAVRRARSNEYDPVPRSVSPQLADITEQCLSTDPNDRPKTAEQVAGALREYLAVADRQEESRALTEELTSATLPDNYEDLSDASRRLSQAEHLWPQNPDIAECRRRVLQAFAGAAIERRDLLLAELQTARLQDEEESARLTKRIEVARAETARRLAPPPLFTLPRVFALAGAWAAVIALMFWIVQAAERSVLAEVHSKVQSIAALTAAGLDPAALDAVNQDREIFSGEFERTSEHLNLVRRSNEDVRFITTVAPGEAGGWVALVDADPLSLDMDGDGVISDAEQGIPPGEAWGPGTAEMASAYEKRQTTSAVHRTPRGEFLGGFAPVVDYRTREPVALAMVEVSPSQIGEKVVRVRAAGTLATAVLLILVTTAFVSLFASQRARVLARRLEEEVRRQNAQVLGTNLHLG